MKRVTTRIVVATAVGLVGGCTAVAAALAAPTAAPQIALAALGGGAAAASILLLAGPGRRRVVDPTAVQRAVESRTRALSQSNEQIQLALVAAEAADRAKTNFLTNVSHELRTPLTAILGYADLLTAPDLSTDQRAEFVQQVRRSGRHLLALINDLLDISRIETGELTITPRPSSPMQLLEEVTSMARPQIAGRPIRLETSIVLPIPETVHLDPDRVRQVLMSLLGNAIKFTEHGSVTLRMSLVAGAAPMLRFEISDTGPGIDPSRLEAMFETFSQRDASAARRHSGLGTGLPLARRLVTALGGRMEVESGVGVGSTFIVELPTGPLDAVPMRTRIRHDDGMNEALRIPSDAPAKDAQPLAGRRILFVEDGPDNRRLVCFHLHRAGASVETAENGRQGHDAALAASRDGRPFDVVFMDMQMPDMDGYTATSLLRSEGYRGPVVALTAHAMTGDRERCLRAGCNDYLSKPIDRETLIAVARRWCDHAAAPTSERVADGTRTRDPENHNLVL